MLPDDGPRDSQTYRKLDAAVEQVLGEIRVLFVDDNTLNCRIGYRVLSELGASVECATSGVEALAFAESTEFDVIVLDCAMPGMSGFDVAQQLRQPGSRAINTPIVAVTVNDAAGVRQRASEVGIGQVLCKPLSRENMLQALARRASASADAPGASNSQQDGVLLRL